MRTMNARGMSVLLFAGLLAGGTAAMADDGQFEDWKGTEMGGYSCSVSPSPSSRRMYAFVRQYGLNGTTLLRSDNGGDAWTNVGYSYVATFAINPSNEDLWLGGELHG